MHKKYHIEVSDRWRSGIRHAGGESFDPVYGRFTWIPLNAVEINNSPRFMAFTAKRCKKYDARWKFFSPHSYEISMPNLDPGKNIWIWLINESHQINTKMKENDQWYSKPLIFSTNNFIVNSADWCCWKQIDISNVQKWNLAQIVGACSFFSLS